MFRRRRFTAVRSIPADYVLPGDLIPVDLAKNMISNLVLLYDAEHSKTVGWVPVGEKHNKIGGIVEIRANGGVYVVETTRVLQVRIPAN
jgi:hypothetical protein